MEIKKLWKNNKGSGFPLAVVITICLVMIFTGITEYFRLIMIAQGVRDALQSAVISTVNDNYDDVYHGVREGYETVDCGSWNRWNNNSYSNDRNEV